MLKQLRVADYEVEHAVEVDIVKRDGRMFTNSTVRRGLPNVHRVGFDQILSEWRGICVDPHERGILERGVRRRCAAILVRLWEGERNKEKEGERERRGRATEGRVSRRHNERQQQAAAEYAPDVPGIRAATLRRGFATFASGTQ